MTDGEIAHDAWTDRLSEYLDGELGPVARRRLEHHLRRCSRCSALLEDLRGVVRHAPALAADAEPDSDLWPDIAARLSPRVAPSWHGLLAPAPISVRRLVVPAMAIVMIVAAAVVVILVLGRQPGAVRPQQVARPVETAPPPLAPSQEYDDTVAELRRVIETRLTADPQVLEVIDRNLESINVAIADYSDALARRPGDARLRQRLEEARNLKVEMLRQAASLASDSD
jgi:anti-sigma factor RsiW